MSFASCCASPFKLLSRAAAKATAARFRERGMLRVDARWAARATLCERCPMRVIRKNISYCGKPYLEQVERDAARDGCGCPTIAKAKTPNEHCPLNARFQAASAMTGRCDCRWCALAGE